VSAASLLLGRGALAAGPAALAAGERRACCEPRICRRHALGPASAAPEKVLLERGLALEQVLEVLALLDYLLDLRLAEVLLALEVLQLGHHLLHQVPHRVRHASRPP
jgi:hypothetical protein